MKKICVVTGARSEYGLLRWVMEGIRQSHELELQLIATGTHLSPEFGTTVDEIEADGFAINRKVEMLLSSDSATGINKSMGLAMIGFGDALAELNPDLMLVLGDRYEIFAAVTSATIARIPIAHLHGGEASEGAFDEAIRHSITKMSHLHFVAAEEYRLRVIQLGEQPDKVFNVGGVGIDNIMRLDLLSRKELEDSMNFKFQPQNLLITFHPVTLEKNASAQQMKELLLALAKFKDIGLIFTMPNADNEGRNLTKQIESFCGQNHKARFFTSLGQLRYLSCIQHVDGVVGNSSSGLTEVPSFKKGTINIGDRQRGRLKADSIIDCKPRVLDICNAISKLFSIDFKSSLISVVNPYGNGGASEAITKILENENLGETLIKKRFNDLPLTNITK